MTTNGGSDGWRPLYLPAVAERLMSKDDCERIISIADGLGFTPTTVHGGDDEKSRYDSGVRICDAVMLDYEAHRDIYEFIGQAVVGVNNKQYRFEIVGLEPVQVMRYSVGSFFREHSDLGYQDQYSSGRKISLIVQLSEGDAYEGGELVLFGEDVMPRTQGTAFIFPAWLPHRVDKLTAGVRYTLVAWAKGPPFS